MRSAIALGALLVAALPGCHGCKPGRSTPSDEPMPTDEHAYAPDAAPSLAPARCKSEARGGTLGAGVEIGEAVATSDGFAVGLFHQVNGENVASLALVPGALDRAPRFVDLGVPLGDASPPRPLALAHGSQVLAAYFPRPAHPPKPGDLPTRDLAVVRIEAGIALPPLAIPEQRDESLAFDAATSEGATLVAWDEDAPGNARGAIKVALLSADAKAVVASRIVSPDTSDAELPRVASRKNGFWLVYIASRAERARDAAPDPIEALERPGRDAEFRWLELVLLDEHGTPTGPARKLTHERGHVALFDIAPRGSGDVLDIVARDDDQSTDGAGGRILRAVVKGDAPEGAIAIVGDAVGRGAPDLLTFGDGAWLAYDDVRDQLRLLPLDAARAPAGLPSIEDALDGARPLGATKLTPDALELLAAFPAEPEQLRRVRCAR